MIVATGGESPALSIGVMGCEDDGEAAIIFCLTSRILSCKHNLVGKTDECFAWKDDVDWLVGKRPFSWNSIMTKCLRWSRVFLRFEVIADGEAESSWSLLNTRSGLKSAPKNVWLLEVALGVDVDIGVSASLPRPSVEDESFLFRFLL